MWKLVHASAGQSVGVLPAKKKKKLYKVGRKQNAYLVEMKNKSQSGTIYITCIIIL